MQARPDSLHRLRRAQHTRQRDARSASRPRTDSPDARDRPDPPANPDSLARRRTAARAREDRLVRPDPPDSPDTRARPANPDSPAKSALDQPRWARPVRLDPLASLESPEDPDSPEARATREARDRPEMQDAPERPENPEAKVHLASPEAREAMDSATTARRPVPLPATDQHQDGKEDITHWDECHNGDDDRWIGIFILTIFCQFCEFNFHKRQT